MKTKLRVYIRRLLVFYTAVCISMAACLAVPLSYQAAAEGLTAVVIGDSAVPLASGAVLTPESPGKKTIAGGGATVDISNANEGYITAKYSGSSKAKIQIKNGKTTYTYNLRSDGKYETFGLSSGNGKYVVTVFSHVSGNQYAQAASGSVDVKLRDASLPYLYPNQFVNFTAKSTAVAQSDKLAANASNKLGVVSNVYNYVIGNISYDTAKAEKVSKGQLSGYVPNVDDVLSAKKGICFDYAALMASMLRAQGIPTRLEVGYVSGGAYHAWISTYIKDVGWINDVIQFDGKNWKLMDPTFASSQGANSKYVGKGSDYQTVYRY